jgi:hypothetical protein
MTFTPRMNENGGPCCLVFDQEGEAVRPDHMCERCRKHFGHQHLHERPSMRSNTDRYAPPDPYAHDLKRLRAALSTDMSRAEDDYGAARRREFAEERGTLVQLRAAHAARVTGADLRQVEPPNPYEAGIKAMQEARR